MSTEIRIKDILLYLTKSKIDFEFKGNDKELINGYSTLFNYKEETMTFISTLYEFKDFESIYHNKEIKLIIAGRREKEYGNFKNIIKVDFPKRVFFDLLEYFYGNYINSNEVFYEQEKYRKLSYVSEKSNIGKNVKIGIGCVIEEDVIVGDNTVIHHNVIIRRNTIIGKNCTIFSGVVIGESGFNPLKKENNERILIKHYGGVILEDNVHIGDNCTVSKGTIEDTIIKQGAKLNKQVTVAHNVKIGKNTVVTAPTFIGGSVEIGDNCHIAATSIKNQCKIGNEAVLGLGSVVVRDVSPGVTVIGVPAKPLIKEKRKNTYEDFSFCST